MAKRKVTVTVDEELIAQIRALDGPSFSGVVNDALREHVGGLARHQALSEWLVRWERELGPIPPEATADAEAAFDRAEGMRTEPGAA